METWITSDLHIGHANIMKYCPKSRPFTSVEEMNETIVSNWNDSVRSNDTVYILGDVAFGPAKEAVSILDRLNGKKILIVGNHDNRIIKSSDFCRQFKGMKLYNIEHFNNRMVVMFHFPIEHWDQKHRGSFHLHGHCHSRNPVELTQRRFDVGLDGNECKVHNLHELLDYIEKKVEVNFGSQHT